jgi:cell division cycle protein 20 (cofactor of APC complex)
LRWTDDGLHLAVGSTDAKIALWNVGHKAKTRTLCGHGSRVSALAWNGPILSSGSRDTNIFTHDIRIHKHHLATLSGHNEEVCGLTWSPDGAQLASGGNDNLANVWDRAGALSGNAARFCFSEHQAAVKALAWCPFQRNLLATGGGTADRHIRFFDTSTGTCMHAVDTKSQVCSIQWSHSKKELLSSHGFSQNQLTVWKYPTMTPITHLSGHTSRVLHTTISPDATTVHCLNHLFVFIEK